MFNIYMSSPVNAPTTLLPPITVSSTEDPTLFEQPNDSVHNLKVGGRRRRGSRKSKRRTKRRAGSKRRTAKKTTFLSKWLAIGK